MGAGVAGGMAGILVVLTRRVPIQAAPMLGVTIRDPLIRAVAIPQFDLAPKFIPDGLPTIRRTRPERGIVTAD